MKADAVQAFHDAAPYHQSLRQIYEYYMPYRLSTIDRNAQGGGQSPGARLTDKLFDATGVTAAYNFAGTLQADWMPLNQPFFKLEAGAAMPPGDGKKALNEALSGVTEIVEGAIQAKVPPHVHEFGFDLFAGTAAMLLNSGSRGATSGDIIRPETVPPLELAFEDGPWGNQPWHVWRRRNWKARDLDAMWPNGRFSDRLNRQMKDKPRDLVEVIQYVCFDHRENRWYLKVWATADGDEDIIHTEDYRITPWVISRFFKVPGETFGRGLGHLGLPFVKTANKTRELALTAAALAVMGIFLYRNDGVFNAETSKFSPLALWKVASTGGTLGASIQRLPVPSDFDVTSIVMQEEREQIRKVALDDELPPEGLAVRSATEVAGRLRRYAKRWGGVNTRLGAEWIVPTVQRGVDILEDANILPVAGTRITIDQLLTKCTVVAPAMAATKADRVENAVNYLQMMIMLFGPQAALVVAKVEELLPEMGRWMAIDERFLRSGSESKALQQGLMQMIAAQQQAAAKPAPPPAPGQDYVNGSARQ